MANAAKTKGLGRGLSALMGEAALVEVAPNAAAKHAAKSEAGEVVRLLIANLQPGKYQPRRHFDATALEELASSITKHGLMQPIMVRKISSNLYEIIAGERRWRAAKLAKLNEVPVIIREASDEQALELALIENIQRSDLNPLEEAAGYQRLMDEFGYTQEKLVPIVGKSRSHIANLLRLLKLPEGIKRRIDSGELTMGHARALLMAKDPEALAQQIIEIGLSVRQAEDRAKGLVPQELLDDAGEEITIISRPKQRPQRQSQEKSNDVLQLENMLADSLGLRVAIDTRSAQAGEVVISYETLSQLDEILRRLGGGV